MAATPAASSPSTSARGSRRPKRGRCVSATRPITVERPRLVRRPDSAIAEAYDAAMKITDVRTVLLTGPEHQRPVPVRESQAAQRRLHRDPHRHRPDRRSARRTRATSTPRPCRSSSTSSSRSSSARASTTSPSCGSGCTTAANFWARVGLGTIVLNGIEAALWDLKGKLLGVPVYELLGGRKHDQLPAYATGGPIELPARQAQGQGGLLPLARVHRLQGGRGLARDDARRREALHPDAPVRGGRLRGREGARPARALRPRA